LAGHPPTTVYGSTSFVTIEPAEITAPSPIVTPGKITDFAPTQTSLPIFIEEHVSGWFFINLFLCIV